MCRVRLLWVLVSSLPGVAFAQGEATWRSVDYARQLRDTMPQRVRVQYSAGRVDVRGSKDPLLYGMHLRYDEARSVPLHSHDAEQRSTVLGLEPRANGMRNASSGGESGEMRLTLPRSVPLDLSLEFGGTESTLDLGGLALQALNLKCGAADAKLLFSSPNRTRMRDMDVSVGAADFTASHLANANAEQMRIQGGVGDVDLDFSGTWTRDLTVVAQLAVGRLTLRLPPGVGVRLEVERVIAGFDHAGLVKRTDGWYSPNYDQAAHKVYIRAQTFLGKVNVLQAER